MPFLIDALQHPSSSVRGIVERMIISLYDHDKRVKKYFSESDVSKRNITYRRIFETFEKVDKQVSTSLFPFSFELHEYLFCNL